MHASKDSQPGMEGVTLADFLRIVSQRKALVFLISLLTVATAVGLSMLLPKRYQATATIRVVKPEASREDLFGTRMMQAYDPYFVQEQKSILSSGAILELILDDEKFLKSIPPKEGEKPNRLNLRGYLAEAIGGGASDDYFIRYIDRNMLDLENDPGTNVIKVTFKTVETTTAFNAPELAAACANRIVQVYEKTRRDFLEGDQNKNFAEIEAQLRKKEVDVTQLRNRVETIRQKYGITAESASTSAFRAPSDTKESLATMERARVLLLTEVKGAYTKWKNFADVSPDGRIKLISSENTPDPVLLNLMEKYLIDAQQFEQIKQQVGEQHPDYVKAQATLAKLREQLDDRLAAFVTGLEFSYRTQQAKLSSLEESVAEIKKTLVSELSSGMREYDEAVRDLDSAEKLLLSTRIAYNQRVIDRKATARNMEVLSRAEKPIVHYFPRMDLNVALGIFGGLVLGVASAFLVEFFDTSFRSVEDIERSLGLPVLGVIPKRKIIVRPDNINSPDVESYRVIQTNMDLAADGPGHLIITVQSAGPGEGKSTTIHNLAATMAMSGLRVLLIDSDVRRPSQHKIFGLPSSPGLVDVLSGHAQAADVIRHTDVPGLDFIASGVSSMAPVNMSVLHSKRLINLLDTYGKDYDRILLDSPPVIGISDAAVIANRAATIFLIQHKRNPQSMSIRACQIMRSSGAKVLGVILAQVPLGGNEDYSYYTSNYSYYTPETGGKASSGRSSSSGDDLRLDE